MWALADADGDGLLDLAEFKVAMRLMMALKQGQPLPLIEPLRPAAPPAITARAEHAPPRAAASAPYSAGSPSGHAASTRAWEADDAGAPLQLRLALLPVRAALAPASLGAALRCVRSLLPPKASSEGGSEGAEAGTGEASSGGSPPVAPRNARAPSRARDGLGLALEVRLAECACELWLLLPPEPLAAAALPAGVAPVAAAAAAAQVGVCLRLRAGGSLIKAAASQQLDLELAGIDCRVATLASHADPAAVARRSASCEEEALAAHAAAAAPPDAPLPILAIILSS